MTIVFFKQTSLSAFHLTHDCGMLFDMTRVYLYIVFRLLLGGDFRHAAFSIHFGFAVYWCIGNIKTKKTKKKNSQAPHCLLTAACFKVKACSSLWRASCFGKCWCLFTNCSLCKSHGIMEFSRRWMWEDKPADTGTAALGLFAGP